MAIFMSDEELLAAIKETLAKGMLVETGWQGFKAVTKADEQDKLAFWAGSRCIFDTLHRLGALHLSDEDVKIIWDELGSDPFCRPPN